MADKTMRLGRIALDKLDLLMSILNESRRRGKFDILLNDNVFVTMWKRKKIRESEAVAAEAKEAVVRFRDALREDHDLELNTQEFFEQTMAIDYFLGIFGSLAVQGKIVANIEEVQKVRRAVADAMEALERTGETI